MKQLQTGVPLMGTKSDMKKSKKRTNKLTTTNVKETYV